MHIVIVAEPCSWASDRDLEKLHMVIETMKDNLLSYFYHVFSFRLNLGLHMINSLLKSKGIFP